jgi:hypothetical protein
MAKSPDDRYASMREFDAALAEFEPNARAAFGGYGRTERPSTLPTPSASEPFYTQGWPGTLLRYCTSRAPELARSQLWMLSLAGGSYLFAGLVALGTSLLRLRQPDGLLTGQGLLVCTAVTFGVLCIPAMIWAQHLFWFVWPDTSRVVALLARSRRVLLSSVLTYAVGMLFAYVLAVLYTQPSSLAQPLSHLFVFPAALLVGGSVAWLEWKSRSVGAGAGET